ncbi:YeeE/YedE family protein [Terrihabitans sp. B22-R8]|uniref:YeeE/YedE family protein n=1 Tax=Terrihabitans sp. B22-R8 TaxID=3425128 RepID=UPI00403D3D21
MDRIFPICAALAVLALAALGAHLAGSLSGDRELPFALLTGTALGIVLQRARFCFLCNIRDFVQHRDGRGVLAILVALAAGAIGYFVVFGSWMPVPVPERLPPDAHIGPVSAALALGAVVFGLGMVVAGSCISAHIYRLGEGSPPSPFALIGAFLGFGLGFQTWNSLFLADLAKGPVVWLPHHLGYPGALAVTLAAIGALAAWVLWRAAPVRENVSSTAAQAIFVDRWPPVTAGLIVGAIGTYAYLRFAPLGVTSQIGSGARSASGALGILPETLYGLDTFRGCATALGEFWLTANGHLVIGIVLGSLASALVAGQFKPAWPKPKQVANGLIGGVLMGWGAMTALGCTVGVLLSGIQAAALAGWVFLLFCTLGVVSGLAIKSRLARG